MASYGHPGTYVEETLTPLSNISTDPGQFGAAFVGIPTGGGPIGPVQVSSWAQYVNLFGGVSGISDDLSYAVYGFFANGGGSTFIVRALNTNAVTASLSINGTQTTPAPVLTVNASAPGIWASDTNSVSRIYVTVIPSSGTPSRFDLIVEVGTGSTLAAREQFVDLSMNRADPRYAPDVLNSPVVGSRYVNVVNPIAEGTTFTNTLNPATTTKAPLTGGSDGTGTPDLVAAAARLDSLDRNLVINVPGAGSTDLNSIVTWATSSGRYFIVADVPKPASGEIEGASVTAQVGLAAALPKSSNVGVYGPWLWAVDPGSRAGSSRLTAAGGFVVGQILKTDASRGVFKAPAGIQTSLSGVVQPYLTYTNANQDALFAGGVNLIKSFPGAGVCINGARTLSTGLPDRYVSVRRFLISLRSTLTSITRFAVFENNDADLRSTVTSVVGSYLQGLYDLRAFKGASPTDGFYVLCDDTNNSASDQDAGILNIEVGVALQTPAEFIVIRLGQTQAGTTTSDSLEE